MTLAYPLMLCRLGLAHMVERPLRTGLTVVGVALGVSAFIAVRTANVEVLRSFEKTVAVVSGTATLEMTGVDAPLDETLITVVRQVPDIVSADPILAVEARLVREPAASPDITVLGVDVIEMLSRQTIAFRRRESAEGVERLTAADSLFLGRALAAEWSVAEGDRVDLSVGSQKITLRVAGVFEEGNGIRSVWSGMAVMDIAAAQKISDSIGRLDRIELTTSSSQPLEEILEQLRQSLPASVMVQRPGSRGKQVENMVRAFQTNLTVLSGVGLLVGIFLIYNSISFSVIQRRREIGIFRALGMSERTVSVLFVAEAAAMGLIGGLLGALLGVWTATTLTGLLGRTVSELYASVPDSMVGRKTGPWLPVLLQGGIVGTLVSALGALTPSLDAARTVVVQALAPGSYDVARQSAVGASALVGCLLLFASGVLVLGGPINGIPVFGYAAAFCLLAGLSALILPVIHALHWWTQRKSRAGAASGSGRTVGKIAAEQIVRCSGRSSVTVSALLVGVAIMVGVVMMVRSFRHTVEVWIEETVIADLIVTPQAWLHGSRPSAGERTLPSSWADDIRGVDGVAAVDLYRDVRIRLGDRSAALVSRDLRVHAERSRYLFLSGDSSSLLRQAADEGGIVVSEVLSGLLNITTGQLLELSTPSGPKTFPVVGVFYDYATDGGKIVMDRATYRRWWEADEAVTVFPVYLAAGAESAPVREAIRRRLEQNDGPGAGLSIVSNAELRREILDIFDRTFLLTYALEGIAVLIAVLGIVNTLVTSVLERRREFATLQAIGASEGQIQALVLWEALYLGIIGSILGIAGGVALSYMLIKVINKQSFGWTIQMEWTPEVWAVAFLMSLVVAVLSGYWPARWASRQPAIDGLRYE
ncbi:MAG: ABC transporter permease [Nitrospiraceae bacterium]